MRRRIPAFAADPQRPDLHLRWDRRSGGAALAVSRVWFRSGDRYPMHTHDYPEAIWVERGRCIHRSADGDRPIGPGTVVLVHPACAHGIDADAGCDAVVANVALADADLRRLRAAWPDAPWGAPQAPRLVELAPRAQARLGEWFAAALESVPDAYERDLFILLLWRLAAQSGAEAAEVPPWLAAAVAAVAEPHVLAGGVAALVAASGRSREHVSRSVRRAYGCTVRELVMRLRTEAVARELREGVRPLRAVAAEVGVASLGHFARTFERRYGCRPGAYRRRHAAR